MRYLIYLVTYLSIITYNFLMENNDKYLGQIVGKKKHTKDQALVWLKY